MGEWGERAAYIRTPFTPFPHPIPRSYGLTRILIPNDGAIAAFAARACSGV